MKASSSTMPQPATRLTLALCAAAVLLSAFAPAAQAAVAPPPAYLVEDLGVLPGDSTSGAWGINAGGDVVGWSTGPAGSRAFLFVGDDGMVELPALIEGTSSFARDVNDSRQVVGTAGVIKAGQGRAVLWSDGKVEDLGTLAGGTYSDGWAINNNGDIVGSSLVGDFRVGEHAFLFTPGTGMTDLTPDHTQAAALDINEAGLITGYFDAADGSLHAFLTAEKGLIDLGELPGFGATLGAALDPNGLVVGTATSPGGKLAHMFRAEAAGKMEDLNGKFPIAFALGVNAAGAVVGYSDGAGSTRAILYTPATGIRDLNALISPRLGWVLEAATDINDAGVIVGYAYNVRHKRSHAVRLRPNFVPFPG